MSHIEERLSRALLIRNRTIPRETTPHATPGTTSTRQPGHTPASDGPLTEAAEDLRALCETLLTHTPPTAVADFLTDQVPEPRSALALACILQLSDTDEGARFWWQYAAGAGQAAAAYCLYLHHLAQGESDTADWWHHQTDDVQALSGSADPAQDVGPEPSCPRRWHPANHSITDTSTTTILRVLRHLSANTTRSRSATVLKLMTYIPRAVTTGYLREPEAELPVPGDGFAQRVQELINTPAIRPEAGEPATHSTAHDAEEAAPQMLGETAKR
ncbi:hypothetical protein IGX29_18230 [Streptomyces sp. H28]|uniref:hypothetical protein n=1 Tax=unclassified Streptomyces TaxID=2593676 RepID=UPI001785AA71|nr:hypothetical protein [Streptomyces sp. H28]MBD9733707.1 hypothetical protein [Streptomyces sp. H28]MBM7088372.1 hypothetical protein [Streptomyces sp. S12]